MKQTLYATGVSVTSALGAFVEESIIDISVWLVVMFMVVVADLCMKWYKILKRRDEEFRFSKGLRETLAKIATYFSFVVTAVFVQHASQIEDLSKYAILIVIFGESISIASNYCKAHGLALNEGKLTNWITSKFGVPDDIITKED